MLFSQSKSYMDKNRLQKLCKILELIKSNSNNSTKPEWEYKEEEMKKTFIEHFLDSSNPESPYRLENASFRQFKNFMQIIYNRLI